MILNPNEKNIIAIIPARQGSKGIPHKNIKSMAGKSLIIHSINAANSSKYIKNIIISTDDPQIASIIPKDKVKIIKRPSELATDESNIIDVIFHSLNYLEKKKITADIILLLQPTSPLRTAKDIDKAVEIFVNHDCESVISVSEIEHSPFWSLEIKDNYLKPKFGEEYFNMRRQDLPKLYSPNGAIFISTPQYLKKNKTFYSKKTLPYIMPQERSIDIDTELDFKFAELLLKERKSDFH